MKKLLIPAAALIAVACSNSGGSTAPTPAASTGFAAVTQIVSTNCMPCHSADKHKGGLSLASLEDIMKGGEDGPVVVAGNPDASVLVQVLKGPVPDKKIPQMPMMRAPLSEADQKVISEWVKNGANAS